MTAASHDRGPGAPPPLRVATLNVWGTRGDWPARRDVLGAGLAALDADLFVLQETIVTSEYDQVRDVLDPAYTVVHQEARAADGQGVTTASRWPVGQIVEVDQHRTPRSEGFECTTLVTAIEAPPPYGRVWLANHFPDYHLDHEQERSLQAVAAARALDELATERPGHVIVAGDLDAEPDSTSVRFWTGRQPLDGWSVCYRDAWASAHPDAPGPTFVPENPLGTDWDWPFRRIDYVLVRCARHGGPSLAVASCRRTFADPGGEVSDHYGLVADLVPPPKQGAG